MNFRGPEAPRYRRQYLHPQEKGCLVDISPGQTEWVHFTLIYKHLGTRTTAQGRASIDIGKRIGTAVTTWSAR